MKKLDTEGKTPLEEKLQILSRTFTFIGIWAALIILIANIVILVIQTSANSDAGGDLFIKKIMDHVTLALIIIMVAIPEGLPMTVGVSLAYCVMHMYSNDRILVKDLEKPEVLGQIEEIIFGKTGTLTTENMQVQKFYAQSQMILNSRKNTLVHCNLSDQVKERIKENICYNSTARIEMSDDAQFVPVGNGTEVSLLSFLQDADHPVQHQVRGRPELMAYQIPFATEFKRSLTAIYHPEIEDTVRVYLKGAPEEVI